MNENVRYYARFKETDGNGKKRSFNIPVVLFHENKGSVEPMVISGGRIKSAYDISNFIEICTCGNEYLQVIPAFPDWVLINHIKFEDEEGETFEEQVAYRVVAWGLMENGDIKPLVPQMEYGFETSHLMEPDIRYIGPRDQIPRYIGKWSFEGDDTIHEPGQAVSQ